jgi:hypothetical protein
MRWNQSNEQALHKYSMIHARTDDDARNAMMLCYCTQGNHNYREAIYNAGLYGHPRRKADDSGRISIHSRFERAGDDSIRRSVGARQ